MKFSIFFESKDRARSLIHHSEVNHKKKIHVKVIFIFSREKIKFKLQLLKKETELVTIRHEKSLLS